MLARRLALATVVVLLIPVGASATDGPSGAGRPDSLSRDDILAGQASQAEQRRALRVSIELAGGESVEVAGAQSSGLGGYGQALIAADLDGDADEEILLEQFVGSRRFILAADENGVIWRRQMRRGPWFAGYLVDDFAAGGGNEVLMIAHEWLGEVGERVIFALVGAQGLLWTYEPPGPYHEINGSVEADGDQKAEVAITTWSDSGNPRILALDGEEGNRLTTLRPTLDVDTPLLDTYSQALVTDGEPGQSDEAVFITSLPTGGSFVERLRFADGSRTDYEVIALERFGEIHQGLDYSGDGRRDAFTDGFDNFGVFNPISFASWNHEHGYESPGYPEIPDPVGDLDGDGAEDLCALLTDFDGSATDPFGYEATEHIDCRSGRTGARLWTAASPTAAIIENSYGWPFITTRYDINGDAHPDPILGAREGSCERRGPCQTFRFEASAVDGKTGGGLWRVTDPAREDLMWSLTEGNLDEVAGDDLFVRDEDANRAEFQVLNGLTMEPSWRGVVDPDSDYGHVLDWGHADVDGDGVTEAVVTAYATTRNCSTGRCFFRTLLYLTAFSGSGEVLWQQAL